MTAPAFKIVDRYILKQLLDYFLLGVVVFTMIAFFSDTLLNFIREVQRYGIPGATMLTLVGLQLPKSVAWVLPASGFLAVLMVFNQLNNQFEIISMRMNGISLWRLAVPALILGLLASGLTYVLNDYVSPWCNARTEVLIRGMMANLTLPQGAQSWKHMIPDQNGNPQKLIYVGSYSGRSLGDTTIIDLSGRNDLHIIQARGGSWEPRRGWDLLNVNDYYVSSVGEQAYSSYSFSERMHMNDVLFKDAERSEKLRDETRRKDQGIDLDSESQSFSEMWQTIQRRIELDRPMSRSNYLDLWQKLTWPLGALALIVNAVPLALSPPRQGANRGFTFSIIILFLYYMLFTTLQNVGRNASLDFLSFGLPQPVYLTILAWLPLAIIFLIGVWLIQRKSQVL